LKTILLTFFLAIFFTGCSKNSLDPEIDFTPPKYVEEMPSQETEESLTLGSIYGQGDNPLFADRKAMKINDIVTVTIVESTSASSTGAKSLAKNSQSDLGPGIFTYGGKDKNMVKLNNGMNNYLGVGASFASSSGFQGTGNNNRKENFTTSITARIVKIMSNGNYFISGNKELLINGEKQEVQINGVIRPDDINPENTILSTQIADAKILYKTEGDIGRNTSEGWASRFIGAIWPF